MFILNATRKSGDVTAGKKGVRGRRRAGGG